MQVFGVLDLFGWELHFSCHGGRMVLGAIVLFYPYNWPDGDLSRYQYAKKRWVEETGAGALWWLKQQQETLLQAYANSVLIATPVILVGTNPNHSGGLRPLGLLRGWSVPRSKI